jgi:hypothetical protein
LTKYIFEPNLYPAHPGRKKTVTTKRKKMKAKTQNQLKEWGINFIVFPGIGNPDAPTDAECYAEMVADLECFLDDPGSYLAPWDVPEMVLDYFADFFQFHINGTLESEIPDPETPYYPIVKLGLNIS